MDRAQPLPKDLPASGGVPFEQQTRSGGLRALEPLTIAWRSIRANVLRSALTTLGIIIGVAAVIALTSLGTGVTASVTARISSLGTNLLTISTQRGGGGGGLVRGGGRQTVTLQDAAAILALNDWRIAGVAPVLQTDSQLKAGANNTDATVVGTWAAYAAVRNAAADAGTFFTDLDNSSRKRVAVLGYDVANELFPAGRAVGQKISLAGVSYDVLGTIPDKGASFGSANGSVFIPLNTYLQRVNRQNAVGKTTVQAVYVGVTDAEDTGAVQGDLERLVGADHDPFDPSAYDFQIQNQADSLASLNSVTQTLTLFLGAIAGISLLVGGIGIMNIMLVSVTERTREIGVRKALGAKPRDILTQFLLEAVLLSIGGGLIGIVLGLLIAFVVVPALGFTAGLSLPSLVAAFLFSAAVGIFFGFYPAQRAARLDPVDSLRYE